MNIIKNAHYRVLVQEWLRNGDAPHYWSYAADALPAKSSNLLKWGASPFYLFSGKFGFQDFQFLILNAVELGVKPVWRIH